MVAATAPLTGAIEQVPSTVSAIKVDGERAYALAREGATVELKARPVTVHRFDVLASRGRRRRRAWACSTSTSRSTARPAPTSARWPATSAPRWASAATSPGCGVRRWGRWTWPSAADLALALETGELPVVPLEQAVATFFACLTLDADQARDVSYGRALDRRAAGAPGRWPCWRRTGRSWRCTARTTRRPTGEPRAVAVAVFL